jgi:hypothetical protein
MAIRGGGVTLPSSKLDIIVTTSSGDPAAVEQLKEIWIKIFDVPPPYRQAVRILLATRQLGRPIAVDEGSLKSPLEPVRVLFGCKTPVRLPPYIMLFVNSQGFKVRVLPEQEPEGPKDNPPPPPRQQFDDKDEDIEESEGEGWDGCRGKHNRKNKEPAKGTSGDASEPKRKSVPMGPSEQVTKLPDSAMNQYGSNLTDSGDIFPALAKIVSAASTKQTSPQRSGESGEMVDSDGNQPPTSPSLATDSATPEGGPASVRMSLWKAQPMSSMDREEGGITSPSWESYPDTMRVRERRSKFNADRPSKVHVPMIKEVAMQLDFAENMEYGAQLMDGEVVAELAVPVARAPRSKAAPVSASRTSARGAGSSVVPVLEKAMQRAKDKVSGNSTNPLSPFSVLQQVLDAHLLEVPHDSCIVFPSAAGNPAPLLSMIRARELAQADLALARNKIE